MLLKIYLSLFFLIKTYHFYSDFSCMESSSSFFSFYFATNFACFPYLFIKLVVDECY